MKSSCSPFGPERVNSPCISCRIVSTGPYGDMIKLVICAVSYLYSTVCVHSVTLVSHNFFFAA